MRKILTCNLMYLYTSIFCAGIQNMVTQMFFDTYYPENKESLLSVTLFFGALFTMLGILASYLTIGRKALLCFGLKGARRCLIFGMLLMVIGTFSALFYVKRFLFFIVLFSIASFCVNYIYNVLDVFLTADIRDGQKEKNVRVLLGYQMLGYMIAPLFFSTFVTVPPVCIGFAVIAGICGYLPGGIRYIAKGISRTDTPAAQTGIGNRKTGNRVWPLLYCFFIFTAFYMLMPSVAYLLKDYLNVENYAFQTSIFLAGIVLVSSAVIILGKAEKLWRLTFLSPVSLIFIISVMLFLRSGHGMVLFCAAVISGIGYGVFLSGSRYYVNFADQDEGLVAAYNRIMTAASLFGYSLSAGLGFVCEYNEVPVIPAKFMIILLFFVSAVFVSFKIRHPATETGGE